MTAIFDDGRFGQISNTSYFQNISCPDRFVNDLSGCVVADACTTGCPNALGLRCYGKPLLKYDSIIILLFRAKHL